MKTKPAQAEPIATEAIAVNPPDSEGPAAEPRRDVAWYRQCPVCWERHGGVGTCINTIPPDEDDHFIGRRNYKCDRCGCNFSREFEIATEIVERRVVRVIRR